MASSYFLTAKKAPGAPVGSGVDAGVEVALGLLVGVGDSGSTGMDAVDVGAGVSACVGADVGAGLGVGGNVGVVLWHAATAATSRSRASADARTDLPMNHSSDQMYHCRGHHHTLTRKRPRFRAKRAGASFAARGIRVL